MERLPGNLNPVCAQRQLQLPRPMRHMISITMNLPAATLCANTSVSPMTICETDYSTIITSQQLPPIPTAKLQNTQLLPQSHKAATRSSVGWRVLADILISFSTMILLNPLVALWSAARAAQWRAPMRLLS